MLAQFQSLYPNGSIISELVQIFQGKYIVRASVQIEGVTRATGMAAAETVEAAEDQARNRALMVLGITSSPQASVAFSPQPTSPGQLNPTLNTTLGLNESTYAKDQDVVSSQWSGVGSQEISTPPISGWNIKSDGVTNTSDNYTQEISQSYPVNTHRETEFDSSIPSVEMMSGNEEEAPLFPELSTPPSNVKPFTPRSYNNQDNVSPLTGTGKKKKKSEPVDLSDVIAKTDVELQRLGWTPEQGREYLIKTYGKRGRTLLTEEELYGFLKYLESQPDPIAGF